MQYLKIESFDFIKKPFNIAILRFSMWIKFSHMIPFQIAILPFWNIFQQKQGTVPP